MFRPTRFRRVRFLLVFAFIVVFHFSVARAQSTNVAGGTLSWTVAQSSGMCGPQNPPLYSFTEWNFGSFKFAYGGTSYSVNGSATYLQDNNSSTGCPPNGPQPSVLSLNVPAGSDSTCMIEFTAESGGQGTATVQCPSILLPKYKVTSIIYAPPGNKSSDGYTSSTTNGTTSTLGNSFTDSSSIEFTEGFMLGGLGGSSSQTFGTAIASSNSHAFTDVFSDATGVSLQSNPSNPNAINHAQDLFLIWLNPEVNVTLSGSTPQSYSLSVQPLSNGSAAPPDIVEISAVTMQANGSGHTSVPLSYLEPQTFSLNGQQVTTPGLAAICANQNYYPSCTGDPNGQCGCVPKDFAPILALDPLLSYPGTTSPLNADVSGATACLTPTTSTNCRYVPVPSSKGSSIQETQTLSGPETQGGDSICNSFTQSDSTTTTETLGGSTSESVGVSFKAGSPTFSLTTANTLTWQENQSTGTSSGSGNSQSVNLCSGTVSCKENISIFEDTLFHTFVFQQPTGNSSCP